MKTWKIPFYCDAYYLIDVKAETLSKAIEIAKDCKKIIPPRADSDYIDGIWGVSYDDTENIRKYYNNGKKDEIEEEIE